MVFDKNAHESLQEYGVYDIERWGKGDPCDIVAEI